MSTSTYVVILAQDGCGLEFVGEADTIAEARELCRRHADGDIESTHESLWSSARAGGNNRPGFSAPPAGWEPGNDPIEWVNIDTEADPDDEIEAGTNSYAIDLIEKSED